MVELVCQLRGACVTGTLSCLSPNGQLLAHTAGPKLIVRKAYSPGEVVNVYACLDKVEKIEFSPDSEYVLVALYTRSAIQVFSVKDTEWKCRINEGVAGVVAATWTPDSRSVLTESDFGIYLSVWSLCDNTQSVISLPKPSTKGFKTLLHAFSDCRRYLAVVHRIELQDQIAVYSTNPLSELSKFKARSSDVAVVQWMPNDTHIVTLDSPLSYKCCVYNPSGELLCAYEAYQHALGIRSWALFNQVSVTAVASRSPLLDDSLVDGVMSNTAPSFIALGSYDGKIRLLSAFTWQLAFVFPLTHPKEMDPGLADEDFVTRVEVSSSDINTSLGKTGKDSIFEAGDQSFSSKVAESVDASHLAQQANTVFTQVKAKVNSLLEGNASSVFVARMIKSLPRSNHAVDAKGAAKVQSSGAMPSNGVSAMSWNADGRLLAATDDSHSRCLWIWDTTTAKLVELLVFADAVTSFQWKPASDSLLVSCGSTSLYLWSPDMGVLKCEEVFPHTHVPFGIHSVKWNVEGDAVLLKGKEAFTTCNVFAKGK